MEPLSDRPPRRESVWFHWTGAVLRRSGVGRSRPGTEDRTLSPDVENLPLAGSAYSTDLWVRFKSRSLRVGPGRTPPQEGPPGRQPPVTNGHRGPPTPGLSTRTPGNPGGEVYPYEGPRPTPPPRTRSSSLDPSVDKTPKTPSPASGTVRHRSDRTDRPLVSEDVCRWGRRPGPEGVP